jgi:Mycothiol maleylpyruvate isomerase N-terminal domain
MAALTDSSPLAVELRAAFARFSALAQSAGGGAQPLPGSSTWTVRDAVVHMTTVAPRYSKFPDGTQELADTPAVLPALNDAEMRKLAQQPIDELLTETGGAVETVISQVEGFGSEPPRYRFHGGELVGAGDALGLLLGEFLVHGFDMAKALNQDWPISRQQVSLIWSGAEPILPGWVRPERVAGHHAAYQMHLGDGRQHVLCFTRGQLTTSLPAGRRIDCHVGGSPEAILLVLYRRLSPWRAALTGRVLAWGLRPWLAFSVADRFYRP